jgi:hypothetical protein
MALHIYTDIIPITSWPQQLAILIEVSRGFPQTLQENSRTYLKIRPRLLPTKSIPIDHHSLILSLTLYSLVTEKESLNKLPTNQTYLETYPS